MKILYITASYPYGAGESFLEPEISQLIKSRIQVFLLPTFGRGPLRPESCLDPSVKLLDHRLYSNSFLISSLTYILLNPIKFANLLKKLIFTKNAKALKNISIILKALHVAKIAKALDIEHIHCHWAATSASLAYAISYLSDIEWSMTSHRWDIVENNMFFEKSLSAKFVRYISRSGIELAKSKEIFEPTNFVVIHMGVDLAKLNGISSVKYDRYRGVEFVCVGNLLPVKGHENLIRALSKLSTRNWHLNLFGEGPLGDTIRTLINVLELEHNVTLHGQISHEKLMSKYASFDFDVFIQPSLNLGNGNHEGIPVSLIEAMSFELPVIGTNTGGIPELIGEDCGILVDPYDEVEMVKAIDNLIKDDFQRQRIGKRGRNKVYQDFNAIATTESLIAQIKGPRNDNI